MNSARGIGKRYIGLLLALIICLTAYGAVRAVSSAAGSDSDPVVTQSYVDSKIIDYTSKIADLTTKMNDLTTQLAAMSGKMTMAELEAMVTALTNRSIALADSNEQLTKRIDALEKKVAAAGTKTGATTGSSAGSTGGTAVKAADKFIAVEVPVNKTLLVGESTEIVLRYGTANAISGGNGYLVDLTGGKDLKTGMPVTANHLLVGLREDGRGLKITGAKSATLLVKGTYKIK